MRLFLQHSGLYDVNPGDAVRMDSGETIAQWRKLYFQKFGVRYASSVDVFLLYICINICMYVYFYEFMHASILIWFMHVCMYVCMYIYMHLCMCVCVCIHYIYVCMYKFMHISLPKGCMNAWSHKLMLAKMFH